MVQVIKHISVRLWLTVIFGSLISLICLPFLQPYLALAWIFLPVLPVYVAVFILIGWISHRFGLFTVKRLAGEASIWERAGNTRQAERIFRRAVAVFDSFLISPFKSEGDIDRLTGNMARFYLAQSENDPQADTVITAYLQSCPDDQVVAEAWLKLLEDSDRSPTEYEDLVYLIGQSQGKNTRIQTLITRLILGEERTGFQALQVYRQYLENDEIQDADLTNTLANLFFEERRIDEWALQAYLKAFKQNRKNKHLLKGIAACLHLSGKTTGDTGYFKEARVLLAGIDEAFLRKLYQGFKPAVMEPALPEKRSKLDALKTFANRAISGTGAIYSAITAAVSKLFKALVAGYHRIRDFKHLKSVAKWTAVAVTGLGLVWLGANTLTHLIQSRPEIEEPEESPVEEIITDPFTLQVAAYLKPEHAEKYVAHLKSLGLDAYWTEAQGAKTKWYQVRLSHFAEKAAARAYGESLKAKGIIDDFYVANYHRP